jgi:hypothetical protein
MDSPFDGMRSRDIDPADDRFDLVERRRQQHRFGDQAQLPDTRVLAGDELTPAPLRRWRALCIAT